MGAGFFTPAKLAFWQVKTWWPFGIALTSWVPRDLDQRAAGLRTHLRNGPSPSPCQPEHQVSTP